MWCQWVLTHNHYGRWNLWHHVGSARDVINSSSEFLGVQKVNSVEKIHTKLEFITSRCEGGGAIV